MKELRDPEFDEDTEEVDKPGECRRGRCDGSGWIQVSEAYVNSVCPWPSAALPDNPTDQEQAAYDGLMREVRLLRTAHANSSFPCPTCMPTQFARWRKGHWSNRHDRASCPECVLIDGASSSARRQSKRRSRPEEGSPDAPTPPDRADLA